MTNRALITGKFDAKLHALSKRKDGMVISFTVDPADITAELMTAPLGTFLMLGYQEYDPDADEAPVNSPDTSSERVNETGNSEHGKRRFEDLKPSQQAGILCADPEFQLFLGVSTEESAAKMVRDECNVGSRAALNADPEGNSCWRDLMRQFRNWQRTDNRYAGTPALEGK